MAPPPRNHISTSVLPPPPEATLNNPLPSSLATSNTSPSSDSLTLKYYSDQIPTNDFNPNDLNEVLGQSKSSRFSLKLTKTLPTISFTNHSPGTKSPTLGGRQSLHPPNKSNP